MAAILYWRHACKAWRRFIKPNDLKYYMANKFTSLSQLIASLQQLCQQGCTGRLIITTRNNRFASFDLDNGRIIAVDYANQTGLEALSLLTAFESGSYTFMQLATHNKPATSLPANEEIFRKLGSASSPPAPADTTTLSEQTRALLEKTLANHIGPMAKIICNRVLKSVNDTDSAIVALANQIPDTKHAQAFLAEIRAKL